MDQAHTRALGALQPFVHLATTTKSPSHRFIADLINRATSAQGTYVFTELLQTPAVQSLRAADTPAESRAYLTHLEIFSYGTYEEYQTTPNLPPLSEAQTLKLRQLSLLSIASTPTPLTYANLLSPLSLPSVSALESLITSAIYANLLTARLSPTSSPPIVHITSVAPLRDLRPLSLPSLLSVLSVWTSRCDTVISSLSNQIDTIKSDAARRKAQSKKRQDIVDASVMATDSAFVDLGAGGPRVTRSKATGKTAVFGAGAGGGNNLKRDLEEQQEDDGYDDFIEDGSGGDEITGGSMELDEPALGSGLGSAGSAKLGSGGRGNKKSRGKLHP